MYEKEGPVKTAFLPERRNVEKIGPYAYTQPPVGLRLTQDPLLLSDFVLPLAEDDRVIDIGTGGGIIPLLLAAKSGCDDITGVEVDPGAAQTARENIRSNSLGHRVRIIESDYRAMPEDPSIKKNSFSLVISNPPYVKAGSGRLSPDLQRSVARSEVLGGLSDLLRVTRYLMAPTGRAAFIFPVLRYDEMIAGLSKAGLVPVRVRFVHAVSEKPAKLFMVEASVHGELEVMEPLYI